MKPYAFKILVVVLVIGSVIIYSFKLSNRKVVNEYLSFEEVRDDFLELTGKIETGVPDAFYYTPKAEYESIKKTVSNQLREGMTTRELFQVFYPLVQCLNDAHFSIHLPDKLMEPNNTSCFPIRVIIHENRLYVLDDLSVEKQIKKGAEILFINKLSAKEIITKIRGTKETDKNKQLFFEYRTESVFHNRLYALFGFTENFEITTTDSTYFVKGINAGILNRQLDSVYEFKTLGTETAYLKINQLTLQPDTLKSMLEKDFALLKKQAIRKLVIDIRGNMGGNSALAKNVFDYFMDTPYTLVAGVDYFHNGKRYAADTETKTHDPIFTKIKFKGKVILLSDVLTYSSAHMMQVGFRHYNIGVTIGNESSEALYITGEIKQTYLKNSKIELIAPTVNFKLPGYSEGQKKYYTPDYIIYPTLSDRLNDNDVILKRALNIVY